MLLWWVLGVAGKWLIGLCTATVVALHPDLACPAHAHKQHFQNCVLHSAFAQTHICTAAHASALDETRPQTQQSLWAGCNQACMRIGTRSVYLQQCSLVVCAAVLVHKPPCLGKHLLNARNRQSSSAL